MSPKQQELPRWLKILIEQLVEQLEYRISNANPNDINALSGVAGKVAHFMAYVVPPELTAIAFNYLGEVIGSGLSVRNRAVGFGAETLLERTGTGIKRLAKRMREEGYRPTSNEIKQAVQSTVTEANEAAGAPLEQNEDPEGSSWLNWSNEYIEIVAGLFQSIEDELVGDPGNGLEGKAWQLYRGLRLALKLNMHDCQSKIVLYRGVQDHGGNFELARTRPMETQRDLLLYALQYNTGLAGVAMKLLDRFDKVINLPMLSDLGDMIIEKKLPRWLSWIKWGAMIFGLLALAVVMGFFWTYIYATSQLAYGLGWIDGKTHWYSSLALLSGGEWHFPGKGPLHASYLMTSFLMYTVFRALLAPISGLGAAVEWVTTKMNVFSTESIFSPLTKLIEKQTGVEFLHNPNGSTTSGLRGLRRIAILLNIIPLVLALVFGLTSMFNGQTPWSGQLLAMFALVTVYLALELMAHSPKYYTYEYRKSNSLRLMKYLFWAAVVILLLGTFADRVDDVVSPSHAKETSEQTTGSEVQKDYSAMSTEEMIKEAKKRAATPE